jgi:hypothetical protein
MEERMDTEDPWDGDDGDALGAEIMELLRLRARAWVASPFRLDWGQDVTVPMDDLPRALPVGVRNHES